MFIIIDEKCTPTRGTKYSACVDLKSRIDITIDEGQTVLIPLGVKINLATIIDKKLLIMPEGFYNAINKDDEDFFLDNNVDYSYKDELFDEIDGFLKRHYFQLMLRSSLSKNLIIANGIGVIDIDYEDEIMIRLHNPVKNNQNKNNSVVISKGDRIAQILLMEHRSSFFDIETKNVRNGGFGSTD
jgi:dUTPase